MNSLVSVVLYTLEHDQIAKNPDFMISDGHRYSDRLQRSIIMSDFTSLFLGGGVVFIEIVRHLSSHRVVAVELNSVRFDGRFT